jgi:hypothetical protein
MRARVSWISAPDGRVIDSKVLDDSKILSQFAAWLGLIGEGDLIVTELDKPELSDVDILAMMRAAETVLPEPLGGPVPGVNGSVLPEHGQ